MTAIVRGMTLSELSRDDLLDLHAQIDNELPQELGELREHHGPKLLELEQVEEELERRESK